MAKTERLEAWEHHWLRLGRELLRFDQEKHSEMQVLMMGCIDSAKRRAADRAADDARARVMAGEVQS